MAATQADLLQCPVCLETYDDPVLLGDCGHTFCRRCIETVAGHGYRSQRCPSCRATFRSSSILPNFALKHLLEEVRETSRNAGAATSSDSVVAAVAAAGVQQARSGSSSMERLSRTTSVEGLDLKRLMAMGMPAGLARVVSEEDQQIAMRIFLLDNSGSTASMDGQIMTEVKDTDGKYSSIFRRCSRWEEIVHTAKEHARWNLQLGTPCEFVLLNPAYAGSTTLEEGVDFQRVDASRGSGEEQLAALEKLLKKTSPKGATPLTARLRKVRERLASGARDLAENGQRVILVIATDGLPTGSYGSCGRREQVELVAELRRFSAELPVHLVVRLCTDDEQTVEFYNSIDEEIELQLEVIDDIRGEARESWKAGNRWLAYSPLVHRLREGGTFLKIFDLLDERRLVPMEVCLFCNILLRRELDDEPLPIDPYAFCKEVAVRLEHADKVYDPLWNRMSPPVRLDEVEWTVLPKNAVRRQCGELWVPSLPGALAAGCAVM